MEPRTSSVRAPRWLVTGLLAAGLAATACAGPSPAAVAPGPDAAAEVKPKVDRLLIAMPSPSREGNNPNTELEPLSVFQLRPMLEWLVGYSSKGEFEPMLATEWTVEPDGRSLRFKLRKGVPFHNNLGEFTAADVVYSYQQITREDSLHPHAPIHRAVKLEVANPYEVVFTMARANAEYLHQLSRETGSLAIVSRADAQAMGADAYSRPLASTGAYQFKAREQGRSVTFVRTPYKHYRITPDFPELEMRWMQEASTRLAALLTGEIHITQLPQDLTPQAEARKMKTIRGPVTQQRTWLAFYGVALKDPKDPSKGYMNPDSPFMDLRVRKALNHAIDRDALNKAFFAGKAEPMYIDKMPRAKPYFNPDWEKNFPQEYGYDPAKARALLQEAGYSATNPLKLRIRLENLSDYGGSEDVEEAVAGFWRKVGVEPAMVRIQNTEFTNVNAQFGYKDMVTTNASSSFDVQAWRVYNSSAPPRGPLELWEVDPMILQLLETLDEKKQYQMLRDIGDKAYSLHMNMPLFWLPAELIINPTIVASWPYPGSVSRVFSHFDSIKAAR